LDKYSAAMIAFIGMYLAPGADSGPGSTVVICAQAVAFSMFWMFGVSMSLFNRASAIDGSGVHFNTQVFC